MGETLTKEEWESVQKMRKSKMQPEPIADNQPIEAPESVEIEEEKFQEDKIEYETCPCGYKKVEKGMKHCPNCGGEFDWS